MRRLALTATLLLSLLAGCVTVKPWERGTLADPPMDPAAREKIARERFVDHVLDVREGSTGGYGSAGGGCGCN